VTEASARAGEQPRRPSALRGRLLKGTGLTLMCASVVVLVTTPTSQPLREGVQLLIGLALIPVGVRVFRSGVGSVRDVRIAAAPTVQDELARDPRAPVLYLRSFKHDPTAGRVEYLDNHSDEEQLSAVLRRIGPVVAVGDPSERRVSLGASRIYLSDDEWQDWVESQMAAAALVIFRASDTDAFLWEVATAANQLPPEKTAFLLPRDPLLYQAFRQKFTEQLERPLPAGLPPITRSKAVEAPIPPDIWGLMYFTPAGQPVFRSWMSAEKLYTFAGFVGWLGITAGRQAARTKQSGYAYLLRPVLRRTGASTRSFPAPFGLGLLMIGLLAVPYLLARTTIRGLSGRTATVLPGWHEDDTYAFRLTPRNHSNAVGDCEARYARPLPFDRPLSRTTALIAGTLQLFLGAVGAGRFYIGSRDVGSRQLGLTALGLFLAAVAPHAYSTVGVVVVVAVMVWGFIDAIRLYAKAFTQTN
jgi:TM2 domain-containing membrane protein YozV